MGDKISLRVTSQVNYFAINDGKTHFDLLRITMDVAEEDKCVLKIIN
ncbi:Imm70 family immunity protein [Cytobacillus sp. Hz8]